MTRRRKGGSDSHFYYKWLDKALCDLQCARLLLTYGGDAYNIAFHCQQAIEKALKGYLLYRTGKLHILFLKISSDLHLKHLDQKHTAHDQWKNRHSEKTHKKLTPERSLDKVLHDPPPFPAMSAAHLSKMDFWFFTAHPRSKSMIEPSSF